MNVLFLNVRIYLRNVALLTEGMTADLCSSGFTVLRANPVIDPGYLFRYTLTDDFVRAAEETQTGTHYSATSDRAVMALFVPLPPLAEQKRIVAKVEEVLGWVTAARERLAKAASILGYELRPKATRSLVQAVLAKAFRG